MVNVHYQGGLGNRLFQYGYALCCCIEQADTVSNPLDSNIIIYKQTQSQQSGIISLSGFFQDRDTIEKFDRYRHVLFNELESREGTFVHIRLGDILQPPFGRVVSEEYYEAAISRCSGRVEISSDSPSHPMVLKLANKFGAEIISMGAEETILYGSSFHNKVLSLGTFSWWIGFLGCQDNVICPDQSRYLEWHGDIFPVKNWNVLCL